MDKIRNNVKMTTKTDYYLLGAQPNLFEADKDALVWAQYDKACEHNMHNWKWTPNICHGSGHPEPGPEYLMWKDTFNTKGDSSCGDFNQKNQCEGNYKARQWAYIRKDEPSVCPNVGGKPCGAESFTPGTYDPQKRIKCYYTADQLTIGCDDITNYTNAKRQELVENGTLLEEDRESWFDSALMKKVCSQQSNGKCPAQSMTVNGEKVCSNLVGCDLCRQWALRYDKTGVSDSMMQTWCDSHFDVNSPNDPTKSDPACKCLKLAQYATKVKQMTADPRCWFGPCQDKNLEQYLVPSTVRPDPASCPENICNQIIDLEDSTDVDISDMNLKMDCGGSKPDEPEPDPEPDEKKKTNKRLFIAAGGLVAVGFAILLVSKK